ncbi:hypothetical protein SAMN05444583_107203 [Rhodococcus maanshanensis]|uniref:Uncharacterized protein n=1 Tax=Rhodococcus maanshanensis TaxID=183556 RepID=A0A1H7P176_9NOCA|nr:hypothetical protein SAMN05444583_107203 [Rhodococcus maanshanensis]
MVPEDSWPWVTTGSSAGKVPLIRLRSEWQIPQYSTLTSTSPGPGLGIGTSSTTVFLESAWNRAARMVSTMVGSPQPCSM